VTGDEVIIGNNLLKVRKILLDYTN